MAVDRNTIETKPLVALREFFSANAAKPCSMQEFTESWKSCSEEEKNQMRELIKGWDGQSTFIPRVQ